MSNLTTTPHTSKAKISARLISSNRLFISLIKVTRPKIILNGGIDSTEAIVDCCLHKQLCIDESRYRQSQN